MSSTLSTQKLHTLRRGAYFPRYSFFFLRRSAGDCALAVTRRLLWMLERHFVQGVGLLGRRAGGDARSHFATLAARSELAALAARSRVEQDHFAGDHVQEEASTVRPI